MEDFYDFDNIGEDDITHEELEEIAKEYYKNNYFHSITYLFSTKRGNVYIINTLRDVFVQKKITRNKGEFRLFGSFDGKPEDFRKAINLVEHVQSCQDGAPYGF